MQWKSIFFGWNCLEKSKFFGKFPRKSKYFGKLPKKSKFFGNLTWKIEIFCKITWENPKFFGNLPWKIDFFCLWNCLKESKFFGNFPRKSKFFDPGPRPPRFQTRLTPLGCVIDETNLTEMDTGLMQNMAEMKTNSWIKAGF